MICFCIMRTTITIQDKLLDSLKRYALARKTTVSQVIEDSVRLTLAPPRGSRDDEDFKLVTYGGGGGFTTLNVDRTAALQEVDDLHRFGVRGG